MINIRRFICIIILHGAMIGEVTGGSCSNSSNEVVRMCHGGTLSGKQVYLQTDITSADNINACMCKVNLKNAPADNKTLLRTSQVAPWSNCDYRLDLLSSGITVQIRCGSKKPTTFNLNDGAKIRFELQKEKLKGRSANMCTLIDLPEGSDNAEVEVFCFQYITPRKTTVSTISSTSAESRETTRPTPTTQPTTIAPSTQPTTTPITTTKSFILHSDNVTPMHFVNPTIYVESRGTVTSNSSQFIIKPKEWTPRETTTSTFSTENNITHGKTSSQDLRSYHTQTLRVGAIIGAVVGVLLLGLLIVMLGFFYRRSRQKVEEGHSIYSTQPVEARVYARPFVIPYVYSQRRPMLATSSSYEDLLNNRW